MKIVLTGSLGNISKPLTQILVQAGHQVTVISHNENRAKDIQSLGATSAIGSVNDVDFLTRTFTGADSVYTMVPPNFGAPDYREYMRSVGRTYAAAIGAAGITHLVNLSSIGAHLPQGTGPIAGLYDIEHILNGLPNLHITHLRPGFFYTNFYANLDMIRHANIIGGNYGADKPLVMVHPADIAAAAADALQKPYTGNQVVYVVSDERKLQEVATVLGAAVGKPGLPWVQFTDEESFNGMVEAGLPEEITSKYVEMGTAIQKGILWEDYRVHQAVAQGKTNLEAFAREFAGAYRAGEVLA